MYLQGVILDNKIKADIKNNTKKKVNSLRIGPQVDSSR